MGDRMVRPPAPQGAATRPRVARAGCVPERDASAHWCATRPERATKACAAHERVMACELKSGTCPVPALLSSSEAPLVPQAFDSQFPTPSGVSLCSIVRTILSVLRDCSRLLPYGTLRVSVAVVSTTAQAGDTDPSLALSSSSTWSSGWLCVQQVMACDLKSGTCPVPALLSSSEAPLVPQAFDSQFPTPSGVSLCSIVCTLSTVLRDLSQLLPYGTLRVSVVVVSTTSQAGDADPSQVSGLCSSCTSTSSHTF